MSRGIPTHFLSHREVGPHQLGGLFSMLDVAIWSEIYTLFEPLPAILGMQANMPRSNLADRVVLGPQKQKCGPICNFFAIRDSLPPSQRGNEPFCSRFAAFLGRNPRFGAPWQSLIAKKLQNSSDFCFCNMQIAATEQIPRIRNGQIAITERIPPIRNWQITAMGRTPPIRDGRSPQ